MEAIKLNKQLVLKYSTGKDKEGKDVFKKQSFSNVDLSATDEDIFAVADILQTLIDSTLIYLLKEESVLLKK